MSAPTTHDPLVVNTQDGVVWQRRALTREGRGLYAVADAPACCPEYVMATLAELAEHGLASMLDALPMPVGPAPRKSRTMLDRGREALNARMSKDDLRLVLENVITFAASLEARVAELEAERHSTNEALDDAVQALRERPDGITRLIAPTQALRDDVTPQVQKLRDLLSGQRAAVEDPHESPLHHAYLVPRDLPEPGGA